jgi:2-dehydro-3-deoxy-D-arabinonate dehydratase
VDVAGGPSDRPRMSVGLYRLELPDGTVRLARGEPETGPTELLPRDLSIDAMLGDSAESFASTLIRASSGGPAPDGCALRAPLESQEVWGAGVTYLRSKDAREQESLQNADLYGRVYEAERPEVFFKSPGWRVRGSGQSVAVRADSPWNAPEPELALVLSADMQIAGFSIGNDVSSRSIEGENPLYLPQAKIYDGSCALGPSIVTVEGPAASFRIRMEVVRAGLVAFSGETSTERMKRSFDELISCLGEALGFPVGAVLLTGTGIVPGRTFTLEAGDLVRIAIDGLGTLENSVVEV